MPRQSESSRSSGRELIGQTQDIWQQFRDQIPHQQRRELGEVLTELTGRIQYTCQGQQPRSWSKYSTLGGAELASHATRTVQKVSSVLPVDASRQLATVITEMAHRVRYAAEGEPQSSSQQGNGEGFNAEMERQMTQHSQHEDTVFA